MVQDTSEEYRNGIAVHDVEGVVLSFTPERHYHVQAARFFPVTGRLLYILAGDESLLESKVREELIGTLSAFDLVVWVEDERAERRARQDSQ